MSGAPPHAARRAIIAAVSVRLAIIRRHRSDRQPQPVALVPPCVSGCRVSKLEPYAMREALQPLTTQPKQGEMDPRSILNGRPRPATRRRLLRGVALLSMPVVAALLAGCQGVQSALDPAGDDARRIATLSSILFIGAAAIFALVTALTLYALYAPE